MRVGISQLGDTCVAVDAQGNCTTSIIDPTGAGASYPGDCVYGMTNGICNTVANATAGTGPMTTTVAPAFSLTNFLSGNSTVIVAGAAIIGVLFALSGKGRR